MNVNELVVGMELQLVNQTLHHISEIKPVTVDRILATRVVVVSTDGSSYRFVVHKHSKNITKIENDAYFGSASTRLLFENDPELASIREKFKMQRIKQSFQKLLKDADYKLRQGEDVSAVIGIVSKGIKELDEV